MFSGDKLAMVMVQGKGHRIM